VDELLIVKAMANTYRTTQPEPKPSSLVRFVLSTSLIAMRQSPFLRKPEESRTAASTLADLPTDAVHLARTNACGARRGSSWGDCDGVGVPWAESAAVWRQDGNRHYKA